VLHRLRRRFVAGENDVPVEPRGDALESTDVLGRVPQPSCGEDEGFLRPFLDPSRRATIRNDGPLVEPVRDGEIVEHRLRRCDDDVCRVEAGGDTAAVLGPSMRRRTPVHSSPPRHHVGVSNDDRGCSPRQGSMHESIQVHDVGGEAGLELEETVADVVDIRPRCFHPLEGPRNVVELQSRCRGICPLMGSR
jgi:hypothetical protein